MKKKTIGKEYIFTALILFVVLAVTMVLDSQLPSYHIVIKVIKKASVYSLVAVSMNLLNGFTGLFSLGQAGFMLLGAYSYAVLCIPVAKRAGVYQYFDGGIVKFSLPEIFAGFLGDKVGSAVGMILALLVGGLIAAFFAYLIGLPVLRLKSDYLAIATLGFAEIMRTIIQWNAIGPLTNASNLLKGYPDFSSATAYLLLDRRVHRVRCAAGELDLRPRVQGHPRRRGRRRGDGHQSCPPQAPCLRHFLVLRGRRRRYAGDVHGRGAGDVVPKQR